MYRKLADIAIGTFLACTLCSCATTKLSVSKQRYLPTGVSSGETILVISASETDDESVEECVVDAITDKKPSLKIVRTSEFRRTLFPEKKYPETPLSSEALLACLQDNNTRRLVEKLGIRYLVVVSSNTSRVNEHTEVELAMTFPGWGIKKFWTRISIFSADIIDVKQRATSGAAFARSEGEGGIIFPVLLVLPLPPFPVIAPTESKACTGLGDAVVSVLEGREES